MDSTTARRRRATCRATRRALAVGAAVTLAGALGAVPASATPDVSTTVTHETVRLVDAEHGILYFINLSRADLCTPERLDFEEALEEWFAGGAVGDPPAEPASSQQGVAEVQHTSRLVNRREVLTIVGDDVPVEAWRLDGEEGGIDCTATDGAGAELFASGAMDFTSSRKVSDALLTGDTRVEGVITDPQGGRWRADVHYLVKLVNGEFDVKGTGRLVPLG